MCGELFPSTCYFPVGHMVLIFGPLILCPSGFVMPRAFDPSLGFSVRFSHFSQ